MDRATVPAFLLSLLRRALPQALLLIALGAVAGFTKAYTRERYGGLEVDDKAVRQAWWRMLPDLWKAWFRWKTKQRDKDIYVPGRLHS